MIFRTKDLAIYFHIKDPNRVARTALMLSFKLLNTYRSPGTKLYFEVPDNHPFITSVNLINSLNNPNLKAIYSISDLAPLFIKKNGEPYCYQQVRHILANKLKIPFHCKGQFYTGFFYLCDLKDFLTNMI